MSAGDRAQAWAYSPKYRRPRHFHAEPELNLVVAGRATFGIGDRIVQACEGDLLTFPPGQDHELIDGSDDLALFAIGLKAAFSREVSGPALSALASSLHVRVPPSLLAPLIARATAVAERGGAEQQVAELWEAAHHARCAATHPSGRAMHVVTRRAMASIVKAPELGRVDLARTARSSPTEMSRHFHYDLGTTLVKFRTRLRLLRFIDAVDTSRENLTAAALESGFGSYSQCHRSFQDTFGCTPRRFFNTSLRAEMEGAFEPIVRSGHGLAGLPHRPATHR